MIEKNKFICAKKSGHMKKSLFIFAIIICICSNFFTLNFNNMRAETVQNTKVYCKATINDNFADDTVIVVINRENSLKRNNATIKTLTTQVKCENISLLTSYKLASPLNTLNISSVLEDPYYDLTNTDDFRQIFEIKLQEHGKDKVLETISKLEQLDFIESAEPDYYFTPDLINSQSNGSYPANVTPNDPQYSSQYALSKINAPAAWSITTGTTRVKVGIIDSGIYNHVDLSNNIVSGWDFFNDNGITTDDDIGHGTHIAGIIGGQGNNGIGIVGVNWNVSLVPLQVLIDDGSSNDGLFSGSAIIKAIDYARVNNIPIINCSFGTLRNYYAYETQLRNYTGLIICSAGNNSTNTDISQFDPASFPIDNIISVASTNVNDMLATSSNYGATSVDIAAPGVGILSTIQNGGYGIKEGTSMAAPYVTGVAALILSCRPDFDASQIKACLMKGTDYIDSLYGKCISRGRLNAYKALSEAKEYNESDSIISVLSGDFNGDGKDDIAAMYYYGFGLTRIKVSLSTGSSFEIQNTWWNSGLRMFDSSLTIGRVVSGDFNGDGYTDIAAMLDYGEQNMKIFVWLSTGSSFQECTVWSDLSTPNYYNANLVTGRMVAGDFNGDGKDDIAVMHDYLNQNMKIFVWKSNGASFSKETWSDYSTPMAYNANLVTGRVVAGDFNGDGKDDIAVMHDFLNQNMKIFVWTSLGGSFSNYTTWNDLSTPGWYNANLATDRMVAGDFNNDGKDDIAVMHDFLDQNMQIFVWKSSGQNFNKLTWLDSSTPHSYNVSLVTGRMVSGDFDGDNLCDIAGMHDYSNHLRLFVWRSNANAFSAHSTWQYNIRAN